MSRKIISLLMVVGLTFGIAGAYASTNASVTLSPTSPSTQSGKAYDLESMTGEFTVSFGVAQVTQGQPIYFIDNIEGDYHDALVAHVYLTNPEELGKVLNNPNSFIDVGLWYPHNSGSENIVHNGENVAVKDAGVDVKISRVHASGTLKFRAAGGVRDNYYVIAQITVPGGVPPGQQDKQDLDFHIDIRT